MNTIWPKVAKELLFRAKYGGFHGSEVRALILQLYPNSGASLDSADTLLREMVEEGKLKNHVRATPSTSQAAFAGLGMTKQGYRDSGWAAGLREHFYYELAETCAGPR